MEASDGREALTKALVRQPWLVMTELDLPLIGGVGLCEILRRDRLTANVPILVVTTETRFSEVQRVWRAGADVVLSKPTTSAMLLNEARRLIQQSHDLRGRATAARARFAKQLERSALLWRVPETSAPGVAGPSRPRRRRWHHRSCGALRVTVHFDTSTVTSADANHLNSGITSSVPLAGYSISTTLAPTPSDSRCGRPMVQDVRQSLTSALWAFSHVPTITQAIAVNRRPTHK